MAKFLVNAGARLPLAPVVLGGKLVQRSAIVNTLKTKYLNEKGGVQGLCRDGF
jgi:hypothetical protein